MKLLKKTSAILSVICLLCSLCAVNVSALSMKADRSVTLAVGTNQLTIENDDPTGTIIVMSFIPTEAGIYRFTLTGATLYTVSGSMYYMYNPVEQTGNVLEKEIKESYVNSPVLLGILGEGDVTLTIERTGDAAFDINALPYETYETTATLTKFTKPEGMVTTYVDITTPHTVVLDEEGNYRLDTLVGPRLYIDLANSPYVPIASAAANGNMKVVLYNEDGTFDKKLEFITCINEYYGYTDNSTNKYVAGYTDGGIYPLTDDMIYIMQTYTAFSGWSDYDSLNYLFEDNDGEKIVVDTDTAWMFPLCYDANDLPSPALRLNTTAAAPGDTVTVAFTLEDVEAVKAVALSNITYDTDSLELLDGQWADLGGILTDWDADNQNAVIAFTENTYINREIFTLTFRVKDTAAIGSVLPVSCDIVAKASTDAGEAEVSVAVESGSIQVLSRGDANADGAVTAEDAVYLLYYTMMPEDYPIVADADYNGDGTVDSDDAICLLYHALLPDLYPLA